MGRLRYTGAEEVGRVESEPSVATMILSRGGGAVVVTLAMLLFMELADVDALDATAASKAGAGVGVSWRDLESGEPSMADLMSMMKTDASDISSELTQNSGSRIDRHDLGSSNSTSGGAGTADTADTSAEGSNEVVSIDDRLDNAKDSLTTAQQKVQRL